MKNIITTLALTILGWACMIQSILVASGYPPLVPLDGKAILIVQAVACLFALRLSMKAAAFLGRVGLFLSAAPLFALGGVVGFGIGGIPGLLVGAILPAITTWKFGIMGLGGIIVITIILAITLL